MPRTRTYIQSKDGIQRTSVTVSVRLTERQIEILEIIANKEGNVKSELENVLSELADNLEEYAKDFGYIKR